MSDPRTGAHPEPEESTEINPWFVMASVAMGLFMVVIDITILNIALPSIADAFQAPLSNLEWALIAYTLALTGLVPFFGRVSDVIGRKRLFITGVLTFAVSSLLCALSPSLIFLIGARVLQAFGGAMISTNTLAIITDTFPEGKRGAAMGVQAILISGGAAVGPTLGGFLVTNFGWEAVFYINIPIGLAAAAVAVKVLPPLKSNRTLEPIDWFGGVTLMGGATSILLAATKGASWGWTSATILLLAIFGIFALAVFVMWELRVQFPLVDLSLFRIRQFSTGQLAGMFTTISLASMTFLFPFYWQGLRGYSAQETGLLMLPIPLTLMITAPLSGRLSDARGARIIASAGLLTIMAALYFISGITADMEVWNVLWRLMILGAGLGMFMAPNNNAVMSSVPAHKRGISAGLLGTFRFTGQSLGIALSGVIISLVMSGSGGVESEGLPSPDTLASLAQNQAALEAFRADFITAMNTVSLVVIPLVAIGAILSFAREGGLFRRPALDEAQQEVSAD